jgi:hypothetical protein
VEEDDNLFFTVSFLVWLSLARVGFGEGGKEDEAEEEVVDVSSDELDEEIIDSFFLPLEDSSLSL